MDLRPALQADFLILANADDRARDDESRRDIIASRIRSRHGARIIHRYAQNHRIAFADLEEMQDLGLIKMTPLDQQRVRIRITADGHQFAAALRRLPPEVSG